MVSKTVIILLSLCVAYSFGAVIKRDTGNASIVDNAGEEIIVPGNANKEDLSLRDIKDGVKRVLGIGQTTVMPYDNSGYPAATGMPYGDGMSDNNNVGGDASAGVGPTHPSKMKQILKAAAQGALAGAAAAAVGTAVQNRNN